MTTHAAPAATLTASTDVSEAEWTAYVAHHPDATLYHQWPWGSVFRLTFGHETDRIVAREDGRIVGVLPVVTLKSWLFGRFLVSLPFVNYGGVLAASDAARRALLDEASRLAAARGLRHVELRHRSPQFPDLPARRHKVAMTLALPADAAALWEQFDRKVRNQIRKAEKSGLTVETGGAGLVGDFYRVFARNMRDLGTPVYPRRLFDEVLSAFPEAARVFLVRLGRRPVAGAMALEHRGTLEVPWASSLREHASRCPNHLLYWAAIRHAIARGCTTFDFGRSTPDGGTYRFKHQWGARPQPLAWEYLLREDRALPDQGPTNPRFSLAIAAWKRLPMAVANAIGPAIVRGIP
jgi:FemAB-related protein (PEP-CTERM system-associated)